MLKKIQVNYYTNFFVHRGNDSILDAHTKCHADMKVVHVHGCLEHRYNEETCS